MSQLDHGEWHILIAAGVKVSSVGLSVDCPTCGGTVPLSICRSDRNGNGGKPLAKHPQCRFFHFFPEFLSFPNILSMILSRSSSSPDPASAQPSARSQLPSTLFPSSSLAGPFSGPALSTEPAPAQHDCIRALAFLPDGRRLAVVTGGSHGGTATQTVWNLDTRQRGPSVKYGSEIWSLAMTWDGTKMISVQVQGGRTFKVWEVESHKLVREWIHSGSLQYPEVAIAPNDRLIAIWDSRLAIYTMEGRMVIPSTVSRVGPGERVHSMCFSPDGHKLACVSVSGDIHAYETTGKLSGTHILGP